MERLVEVVERLVLVVEVLVVERLVELVEIEVEVVLVLVVLVEVSHCWRRSSNPSSLWNCSFKGIVSSSSQKSVLFSKSDARPQCRGGRGGQRGRG